MNIIKRAAATVVGAAGGALMGMMVTPAYMVADVFAPVTYPVAGTVLGGLIANATMHNEIAGAVIGLAGGVVAIPIAPFNFITRPVLMPAAQAVTFGVIAYQQAGK